MKESESVELQMDIVWVSDSECVSMMVLVKDAPLRRDAVNVLDWVNVLENVFDSVNVSVGIGMHPPIVVPLDTFKFPNVSFWYVANVITDAAGTSAKALDETVGDVSP